MAFNPGDHIYPFILPNTVTSSISEREFRRQTIHFLSVAKNLLIITTISYGRRDRDGHSRSDPWFSYFPGPLHGNPFGIIDKFRA